MPGVFFTPRQNHSRTTNIDASSDTSAQFNSIFEVVSSTLKDVLNIATSAEQQKDIELDTVLRAEIDRLKNSIEHLERSNGEMHEYLASDPSLQEDIDSNDSIILQQQMRICGLNLLVKGNTLEQALATVKDLLTRAIEQRQAQPEVSSAPPKDATGSGQADSQAMWL
eukprot:TRINITY_DN13033_c0_g1_i1.p1 TRINITY_DN13033_c0_g1~~TRINITY_DN13033_c0_g1_i1.p1  ORF type:complete len:179 (+),score=35.80 TRINITY_DN13033_c0_g1_i1:35-538(+)